MPHLITEPKDKIIVGDEIFTPLFSEKQIQSRIAELGEQITVDYQGTVPVFIGHYSLISKE